MNEELLDLPHKFPIEPHKFMTNLAKDINADSDRLIKSLAPIWALNVPVLVREGVWRRVRARLAPFSDEDYDLFITRMKKSVVLFSRADGSQFSDTEVVFNSRFDPIL